MKNFRSLRGDEPIPLDMLRLASLGLGTSTTQNEEFSMANTTLPTDSDERKNVPLMSGCMNYFPAALAWIARISLKGDRKHNPENEGPPFHARGKSTDHGDCILRHTMDIEDIKAAIKRTSLSIDSEVQPDSVNKEKIDRLLEEAAYRAWRSCADLQELCELYAGAPLAPAARLPAPAAAPEEVAGVPYRLLSESFKGGLARDAVQNGFEQQEQALMNRVAAGAKTTGFHPYVAGAVVTPNQLPLADRVKAPHLEAMRQRIENTERQVMATPLESAD